MDYVIKNQEILDLWKQEYIKNNGSESEKLFGEDGIMNRGLFDFEDKWWYQYPTESGEENKLWHNCPVRILYLTKEQNIGGGPAWDMRYESYHKADSNIEDYVFGATYKFHRNFLKTLYGLALTTDKYIPKYDELDYSTILRFTDSFPYARINCKKEGGESKCDEYKFDLFIEKYSSFLEKQILNLDADVFVCCGCINDRNKVIDFLNSHGYSFKWISYAIYYDQEQNKIAINAYHPSYPSYSEAKYYDDVVLSYHNFIKSHPNFLTSHRL